MIPRPLFVLILITPVVLITRLDYLMDGKNSLKKLTLFFTKKTVDNINLAQLNKNNPNQRDMSIVEALHYILPPTEKRQR